VVSRKVVNLQKQKGGKAVSNRVVRTSSWSPFAHDIVTSLVGEGYDDADIRKYLSGYCRKEVEAHGGDLAMNVLIKATKKRGVQKTVPQAAD
jgi:hypothetical protein